MPLETGDRYIQAEQAHIGTTSDYAQFEADGTLSFHGAATTWQDIVIPGLTLNGQGAKAPDPITVGPSGNLKGPGFDGVNTTEELHGSAEMLHDYAEGTDVSFHLHWAPAGTVTTGDVVKWQLEYSWTNSGATIAAPTVTSVTVACASQWTHQYATFPTLSGAGKTIGSQLSFRVFRDPTDGVDTYGLDALLMDIGIHYQQNTLGSRQMTSKA